MRRRMLVSVLAVLLTGSAPLGAQLTVGDRAIGARLHGTFLDAASGTGVLSGDMSLTRFEVRVGGVTAIGRIRGTLADANGVVLGPVDHEVALPVGPVTSSCNQLYMELGAATIDIHQVQVRLDPGAAGFDSRHGLVPRREDSLCAVAELLPTNPAPERLVEALNQVVASIARP